MLRASRALLGSFPAPRKGMTYLAYTQHGPFTTYSMRQRYPTMCKMFTDSAVADRAFHIAVRDWFGEPSTYSYIFCTVMSVVSAFISVGRLLYFDPDKPYRREHQKVQKCDQKRMWCYCLPFYNHRLRNISQRYSWMYAGADHDWHHKIYNGTRPDRGHAHRRPFFWAVSHMYTFAYTVDDPLLTSNSVENYDWIYHECGYKPMTHEYPHWAPKEEEAAEPEEHVYT